MDLTEIDDALEELEGLIDRSKEELLEKVSAIRNVVDSFEDDDDGDADDIVELLFRMEAENRWDSRSVRDLMDMVRQHKGVP